MKLKNKKITIIFLIISIILSIFIFTYYSPAEEKIKLLLFYSPGCEHCEIVKQEILPSLEAKYHPEISCYDIDETDNYSKLIEMEKEYNASNLDVPVIFIGDQVLNGEKEIRARLESILISNLENGISDLSISHFTNSTQGETIGQEKVYFAYFFSPGCKKCNRVHHDITYLQKKYPNLVIREFDIHNNHDKQLNEAICEQLRVPEEKRLIAPAVFTGDDYIIADELKLDKLEAVITRYSKKTTSPLWEVSTEDKGKAKVSIINRFKSISFSTVLIAGLLDGINPCAFATIIFFISYLTYLGRKKKEVIFVGLSFTLAVFLTYFLVGLGVYKIIDKLTFLPLLSKIVYILTVSFALILGSYNLYDFIMIRRCNDLSVMKLQLPDFLKKRIHKTIREKSKVNNYIIAAFFTGFIVSFLELACTGQVYLPTIIFVSKVASMRLKAFFFLLSYNLMFITPLLGIFIVAYCGITSAQLTQYIQRHARGIKLLTAIFFFTLATVLILTM
ncbi:MAG: hypothetical protein V1872_01430 [bacterium]